MHSASFACWSSCFAWLSIWSTALARTESGLAAGTPCVPAAELDGDDVPELVLAGGARAGPAPSCTAITDFSRSAIRSAHGPARAGVAMRTAVIVELRTIP